MPEAPDLEVIKEYLNRNATGRTIASAQVLRPSVVRSMTGEDLEHSLPGSSFDEFTRLGKFMHIRLSGDRVLVVNPMLTGAFRHCSTSERVAKRTCIRLQMDDGHDLRYMSDGVSHLAKRTCIGPKWTTDSDLRYIDDKQMGMYRMALSTCRLDMLTCLNRQAGSDAFVLGLCDFHPPKITESDPIVTKRSAASE